jgi:hypothetical protein
VGTVSLKSKAASRSVRMLRAATGRTITGWLEDPVMVEIMLNPDGNLSEEAQPVPNRCDDLSRHRWTECLRILLDHQRSDGRRQQVFHRGALVLSRSVSGSGMRGKRLSWRRPKQGRHHHRRLCPNACPRSTPSESFTAVRLHVSRSKKAMTKAAADARIVVANLQINGGTA